MDSCDRDRIGTSKSELVAMLEVRKQESLLLSEKQIEKLKLFFFGVNMKFDSVNQVKLNFTCETSALSTVCAALLTEKALNTLQVFHGFV